MLEKLFVGSAACLMLSGLLAAPALAVDDYLREGVRLFDAGNYEAAKLYFRHATTDPAVFGQARYCLATTYLKMNQPEQAKEEYRRCLVMWISPDLKRTCEQALAHLEKQQTNDHKEAATAAEPTDKGKDNKTKDKGKKSEQTEIVRDPSGHKIEDANSDVKIYDLSELIKKQYDEQKAARAQMAAVDNANKEGAAKDKDKQRPQ